MKIAFFFDIKINNQHIKMKIKLINHKIINIKIKIIYKISKIMIIIAITSFKITLFKFKSPMPNTNVQDYLAFFNLRIRVIHPYIIHIFF